MRAIFSEGGSGGMKFARRHTIRPAVFRQVRWRVVVRFRAGSVAGAHDVQHVGNGDRLRWARGRQTGLFIRHLRQHAALHQTMHELIEPLRRHADPLRDFFDARRFQATDEVVGRPSTPRGRQSTRVLVDRFVRWRAAGDSVRRSASRRTSCAPNKTMSHEM